MDDLIRTRIHDALDIEPPPADLRHSAIWAVPMPERVKPRQRRLRLEWAGGLIAALLAVAIVAGLVYSHGLFKPQVNVRPPAPRLLSPEGIAIGPDGSLYVSDFVTGFVFRMRPDGKLVAFAGGGSQHEGPATKVQLVHPAGLAISGDGSLYVAEVYGGSFANGNSWPGDIKRVEPSGKTLVFAEASAMQGTVGLALDSVGVLYFGSFNGNVGSLTLNGQISWLELPPLAGPLPSPGYMAFDAAGNLYFADRAPIATGAPGGCRLVRITPDHSFSVVAGTGRCGFSGDGGPATQAELDDPNGIAFDSRGNLYFSDSNNHRIRRIDPKGVITTVAGTGRAGFRGDGGPASSAELAYPFGLAISPSGLLFFADASCSCENPGTPGRVRVIDLATGTINSVVTEATPIQHGA